jgi:hypothetical protein
MKATLASVSVCFGAAVIFTVGCAVETRRAPERETSTPLTDGTTCPGTGCVPHTVTYEVTDPLGAPPEDKCTARQIDEFRDLCLGDVVPSDACIAVYGAPGTPQAQQCGACLVAQGGPVLGAKAGWVRLNQANCVFTLDPSPSALLCATALAQLDRCVESSCGSTWCGGTTPLVDYLACRADAATLGCACLDRKQEVTQFCTPAIKEGPAARCFARDAYANVAHVACGY